MWSASSESARHHPSNVQCNAESSTEETLNRVPHRPDYTSASVASGPIARRYSHRQGFMPEQAIEVAIQAADQSEKADADGGDEKPPQRLRRPVIALSSSLPHR